MKTLGYRLIAIALIGAALSLTTESFLTVTNVLNVLRQASLTFLIASGLTLTILTAGLDLSVGANVGLSACLAATVMQSTGSPALGAATGLAFGAGVGMLNGLMITMLRLCLTNQKGHSKEQAVQKKQARSLLPPDLMQLLLAANAAPNAEQRHGLEQLLRRAEQERVRHYQDFYQHWQHLQEQDLRQVLLTILDR